jgi:hypothetical protein
LAQKEPPPPIDEASSDFVDKVPEAEEMHWEEGGEENKRGKGEGSEKGEGRGRERREMGGEGRRKGEGREVRPH